jgi:Mn-dependent DtxR family transcriptional regulator
LTHQVIKEVEKIMTEQYQETKERVLAAILDISRRSSIILFTGLAQRVGMSATELVPYCTALDEEGLILFPGGEIIQLTDAGKRFFEKTQLS